MRISLFYTILILLGLGCNTASEREPFLEHIETDSLLNQSETSTFNENAIDYSDSINFTDSKGLKQGQWIRKWKGKLVENYSYVNDTLHGHYETDRQAGYYKHGVLDGLDYAYYGDKESILMVNYFEDGVRIWGGFPSANRELLVPAKEFHIHKDSVFVKAPYINGQIWYEGYFCLLPDSINNGRLLPHRYGIHRVYHMNGELKGIIDYPMEMVTEYDSLGNLKYQASFDQQEIHNLPTIGRYRK